MFCVHTVHCTGTYCLCTYSCSFSVSIILHAWLRHSILELLLQHFILILIEIQKKTQNLFVILFHLFTAHKPCLMCSAPPVTLSLPSSSLDREYFTSASMFMGEEEDERSGRNCGGRTRKANLHLGILGMPLKQSEQQGVLCSWSK